MVACIGSILATVVESLLPHLEGWPLPARMVKAVVIGLWGKGRGAAGAGGQSHQLQQTALRVFGQFHLTARCAGEVLGPVAPGLDEGMGGNAPPKAVPQRPGPRGRSSGADGRIVAADRSTPAVR